MTKGRIALFGSAMAGAILLCGASVVSAQDYSYSNGPYNNTGYAPGNFDRSYDERSYDDRAAPMTETIIVRPDYDRIEKTQILGRVDGEINPEAYSVSRPVNFSDLDLSRGGDRAELRARVRETASDLCAELDARVPGLSGSYDADRECVRNATRNALRDVMERYEG